MSEDEKVKRLKIGDLMGIRSGTGRRSRIYKIAPVERMTMQRIIVDGRFFRKDGLREVGGLASLDFMTPKEIETWRAEQAKEEAIREERRRNYNPADHDDPAQAALRALRDKTRSLCEKLQHEVDVRLGHVTPKAPHWWSEYLQVLVEIERSENALQSIGLSTTLQSADVLRSKFQ